MTKQLRLLAHKLQARLLEGGGPEWRIVEPVIRDSWATLYRWHHAGEIVWRIDGEEVPSLAPDLDLASAHLHAPAICYQGPERKEWIVVARHAEGQPFYVSGPETEGVYPSAMITYLTELPDKSLAAGYINLADQPTPQSLYLAAGKKDHAWLEQDDIAPEETRLFRALRHWYRPPAIVI